MRIEEIDKNFAATPFARKDVRFYDVRQTPFRIYGLYNPVEEPIFRRMPQTVAEAVSPGVSRLSMHTAGGRVRFKTNSSFIAIHADMPPVGIMNHMPRTGQASFAIYINKNGHSTYYRTFVPDSNKLMEGKGIKDIVEFVDIPKGEMHDVTMYFPLYAGVNNLYIGLQEEALLLPGDTYNREKPVVFYGSSITQGGCASHSGNSYQGFLSRRFDFDFINLGFSGGGKAEDDMIDYVAGLDMSMFVYDYDYNAPDLEHLKKTHDKMFRAIRAKHPDIPVIFMSAPDFDRNRGARQPRRALIFENYARASAEGDKNVYYVDGERLFGGDCRDGCTVDGSHPNDLGFYRMADAVGATMELIFTRNNNF